VLYVFNKLLNFFTNNFFTKNWMILKIWKTNRNIIFEKLVNQPPRGVSWVRLIGWIFDEILKIIYNDPGFNSTVSVELNRYPGINSYSAIRITKDWINFYWKHFLSCCRTKIKFGAKFSLPTIFCPTRVFIPFIFMLTNDHTYLFYRVRGYIVGYPRTLITTKATGRPSWVMGSPPLLHLIHY